MYTLYTLPGTCSTGITVLLERLGVAYNVVNRDDVENYRAIVPTNEVPALKTEDGTIIAEGLAIVLYLLEKHDNDMLPANLDERTAFYQWLAFDYATVHKAYNRMFTTAFKVEIDEETKANLLQQLADKVSALWAILDERLSTQRFITGDAPTHIDYMAAIYASWNHYFPDASITLGANVKRFIKDVSALAEFKAAYQAEKTEYKQPA